MTDLELGPLRFGVVGAGRLGLTLAHALQSAGLAVEHVSSLSAAGRDRASRLLRVPAYEDPLAVTEHVDCVLMCVPDDELTRVVDRLALRLETASPMRLRYVSTSAVGGLTPLAPLADLGHATAVLHPVASVPTYGPDARTLLGAGAAVGAGDDAARALAHGLAHALGMLPFDLPDAAWPLHAAACTAAANFTLSVLAMAEEFATEAGIHEGIARATYASLAANNIARAVRTGAVAAIGGPIVRGDASALAAQAAAVARHAPANEAAFLTLAASTIRRTFEAGRIDIDAALRLGAALTPEGGT